jgi:hypothetical protein
MRSSSCGHWAAVQIAILVAACGGQAVDVGSNGSGNSGGDAAATSESLPAGAPLPVWPTPAACQSGSTSLSGTWNGYVQGLDQVECLTLISE